MRHLSELLDIGILNRDIAEGYISVRAHSDDAQLLILNYTQKTQFSGHWTDATRKSRGLIVRDSGWHCRHLAASDARIEELTWAKFFTAEQATLSDWGKIKLVDEENNSIAQDYAELDMHAPVATTEKLDGSLAIAYRHSGELYIATRGSFDGMQARQASAWLHRHVDYPQIRRLLYDPEALSNTFLFEWIGPSNPIVLPYTQDKLVFLGAVDKRTGIYAGAEQWPQLSAYLEPVKAVQAASLAEALAAPITDDSEGYVVRYLGRGVFDEIAMIKIKGEYYRRLHHALFSLTTGNIYELLYRDGIAAVQQAAQGLPDEIAAQLLAYAKKLLANHARILEETVELNRRIESELPLGYSQKDYAAKAKAYPELSALLFLQHAGGARQDKMSDLAWRMLRPEQSSLLLQATANDV
ncbi:MAG: hypothetical protein LBP28_02585 [Coriobacteriales bacterium]|jgi:hypothetical protein|nr:hypothetical protein [Coriobacteriales bacterium]